MTEDPPGVRIGVGYEPGHHGELLQGVFRHGLGRMRRALVTIPLPDRRSWASFQPYHDRTDIVSAAEMTKLRRAASLVLCAFGGQPDSAKGGRVDIVSDLPWSSGMRSSTSDVTAIIRAIADYHGTCPSDAAAGRLAVQAELASDSIVIGEGSCYSPIARASCWRRSGPGCHQ